MSYGDWVKGIATGFVVTLALIVGFGGAWLAYSWGVDETARYERDAREQSEKYASHTYNPQREACSKLPDVEKPSCEADAENRVREQYRYEQDLVAQRRTAVWTHIMGAAAIGGLLLSTIGVALIWTTFRETRKTTQAARDSANAAVEANANALKAVRIAETANRISADIGKRQLRAYVLVTRCHFETIGDRGFRVVTEIRNFGQTPAYKLNAEADARGFSNSAQATFVEHKPTEPGMTLGPGAPFMFATVISNLHPIVTSAIMAGEEPVYIWGKITYLDCFNGEHTTSFRLRQDGPAKNGSDRFIICAEGNEAT